MSSNVSSPDDAVGFALWVRRSSDEEIGKLLRGQAGGAILGALVDGMPDVFRADRAGTLSAVVHWRISGRRDGVEDVYELRIADRRCVVADDARSSPTLTLQIDVVDFVRMATGNADPRILFLRGRLKARGSLGLTNRLPRLFEVPRV